MALVQADSITRCILCEVGTLEPFLDLGQQPLPNKLSRPGDPPDDLYRLEVGYCTYCGHVQLCQSVPPELMFAEYSYVPSSSLVLRNHFRELASSATAALKPAPHSLVVDIGGNDGLLLSFFQDEHELFGLSVDPAKNLAIKASERGVVAFVSYFDEDAAASIAGVYGNARIITATNCLAHTAQLATYLGGVEKLLAPDGVFIVEAPYLWSMVEHLQFDTIYHEHQSYLAVAPLWAMLAKYGLRLDGVDYMKDVHGGSMRYWITKSSSPARAFGRNSVAQFVSLEPSVASGKLAEYLEQFAQDVGERSVRIMDKLDSLSGTVMGIGASAKCAVTLNVCRGPGYGYKIKAIADANPLKQGRRIPGTDIPIVPEEELADADYVVDFIWNLKADVETKVKQYAPNAEVIELP